MEEKSIYEQIEAAINTLERLVDGYDGRIIVSSIILHDGEVESHTFTNKKTFSSNGREDSAVRWISAFGYMLTGNDCVKGDAKRIREGMLLFLDKQNQDAAE